MQDHPDHGQGHPTDPQLDQEIEAALGDRRLDELVDDETAATVGRAGAAEGGKDVRRGRVVAVHGDDVFVDVGGRAEGILRAAEFAEEPLPEPGAMIEVMVKDRDPDSGMLQLSREGAVQQATWDTLEKGQLVEGFVTAMNKGGLELKVNGIRAFMPLSQIDTARVDDPSGFMNCKIECMVAEVDRKEKNLVVSRRKLLEAEQAKEREKLWETLAEGQTVRGKVRTLMPYGAFVDIGGADGLLHISDMSYGHVDKPEDVVEKGQEVEVRILKIDREKDRIALGLKQTMRDPWEAAGGKWAEGQEVTGRVTKLMDFGAFCELEPGVEGLIPISELTFERHVKHPSEIVNVGDMVKARVLKVEPKRHRISLSLKRMGDDPWQGASVRWPVDSIVDGIVVRTAEFGAFVELAKGVEGLVHISELAHEHTRAVGDVVREGQSVQVKVLEVDEERRRIGLSIKQAMADPAEMRMPPAEPLIQRKKRKRPLKGGLD